MLIISLKTHCRYLLPLPAWRDPGSVSIYSLRSAACYSGVPNNHVYPNKSVSWKKSKKLISLLVPNKSVWWETKSLPVWIWEFGWYIIYVVKLREKLNKLRTCLHANMSAWLNVYLHNMSVYMPAWLCHCGIWYYLYINTSIWERWNRPTSSWMEPTGW